jgi:hypothetical protein
VIEPKDVVLRLIRRKPHWFHGRPKVSLKGRKRRFGKLLFDFIDQVVEYNIFIYDRKHILETARYAIDHFNEILDEHMRSM